MGVPQFTATATLYQSANDYPSATYVSGDGLIDSSPGAIRPAWITLCDKASELCDGRPTNPWCAIFQRWCVNRWS